MLYDFDDPPAKYQHAWYHRGSSIVPDGANSGPDARLSPRARQYLNAQAKSDDKPEARLGRMQLPPGVRLFHTSEPKPCDLDPEPFFDRRRHMRAAAQCAGCHFIGRCAYNAVAGRETHGVWAGQRLPGDYLQKLLPIYETFRVIFEQRRHLEPGAAFATFPPLPEIDPAPPPATSQNVA